MAEAMAVVDGKFVEMYEITVLLYGLGIGTHLLILEFRCSIRPIAIGKST